MIQVLRHLFAIAALPFMVAVVVPVWIARRYGQSPHLGANSPDLAAQFVSSRACDRGRVETSPTRLRRLPTMQPAWLRCPSFESERSDLGTFRLWESR